MMKRFLPFLMLSLTGFSTPIQAADSWGINGEEKARIQVTVVDLLCELTGNCADN